MTREEFLVYMGHFNHKRYADLVDYFCEDIEVQYYDSMQVDAPPAKTLYGRDGFVASYTGLHQNFREFLDLGFFLADDRNVVVELYTEFHALRDATFMAGPMKTGDVFICTNWVCYDLAPDGKFQKIRIAHFRNHDPKTARFALTDFSE